MIDCPNGELRDLLPDYLHDRLESSARASVERHLAECAPCRDELALLRDVRGTLRRAPRIDVAAVAAAIPAYRPPARATSASGWRVAAAIIAIVIGGTSIVFMGRSRQPAVVAGNAVAASTTHGPSVAERTVHTPVASSEPATQPPSRPTPVQTHVAPSVRSAPTPKGEELAMAGGTIADLSDGELSDLIGDLESLDAVPSAEVESTESLLTGRHGGRHD